MPSYRLAALALGLAGLAAPGGAADFSDPTWPCVQRKVERLSIGLMWPLPMSPHGATPDPAMRHEMTDLAQILALRRVAPAELRPRVAEFAARYEGDPQVMGAVFAAVFDQLSTRRNRIIAGIGRFSLSQIALAERIDTTRREIDALLAAQAPDFDRIDALEERLDWDRVIYSDRQKSITYLCETPVLLEKRLFEIARMLQEATRDRD